jgi:hypothetical protein
MDIITASVEELKLSSSSSMLLVMPRWSMYNLPLH